MSLGRTRLPDYSIGATVLLVAIALPFFVFTRAQHLHRLEVRASVGPTPSVVAQSSPTPLPNPSAVAQPSEQPQALPVTAGGASARPSSTPRRSGGGSSPGPTAAPTATASSVATSTPMPGPDAPPVPALFVSPSTGSSPLQVTADASGSSDTDQTPIQQVFINFGDGTTLLADANRQATHTYTTPGSYTVIATVIDSGKNMATTTATVVVS